MNAQSAKLLGSLLVLIQLLADEPGIQTLAFKLQNPWS